MYICTSIHTPPLNKIHLWQAKLLHLRPSIPVLRGCPALIHSAPPTFEVHLGDICHNGRLLRVAWVVTDNISSNLHIPPHKVLALWTIHVTHLSGREHMQHIHNSTHTYVRVALDSVPRAKVRRGLLVIKRKCHSDNSIAVLR